MNEEAALACPGCGEKWKQADAFIVCSRCGVDQQEAMLLLWSEVSEPYAAAHTAAREGRFAEARTLLRSLLRFPVYGERIRRLDSLCAAILGDSEENERCAEVTRAHRDYESAYSAAVTGDFGEALLRTERCLASYSCLLPAQKLRMLSLAGAGRTAEAELLRSEIVALFAAEPDLKRWRFTRAAPRTRARPTSDPSARRVPHRRRDTPVILHNRDVSEQSRRGQNKGGVYSLPVALGAIVIAAVSLTLSLRQPLSLSGKAVSLPLASPSGVTSGVTLVPVREVVTIPDKKRGLPEDLAEEWQQRRHSADFAQARDWFNRAVRAKNRGNWTECDRFAAAAYVLGKNSYLADESLVLRALAADNRGESVGVRRARYAAIAEETPKSVYAPWALRTAARLAEQEGQTEKAAGYRPLLSQ